MFAQIICHHFAKPWQIKRKETQSTPKLKYNKPVKKKEPNQNKNKSKRISTESGIY